MYICIYVYITPHTINELHRQTQKIHSIETFIADRVGVGGV